MSSWSIVAISWSRKFQKGEKVTFDIVKPVLEDYIKRCQKLVNIILPISSCFSFLCISSLSCLVVSTKRSQILRKIYQWKFQLCLSIPDLLEDTTHLRVKKTSYETFVLRFSKKKTRIGLYTSLTGCSYRYLFPSMRTTLSQWWDF